MGFQQGFRINTNTVSLDTYRTYSESQSGLEQNIERLSSGKRINSAVDDAAGLAISERMNNQVRGMQQANRNVQQGTNLLQTAEGAMNEIGNILGRMRELAVQSASDTVNSDNRSSVDLEFEQLKSEIDRIADSTEYNGMKMLNGGMTTGVNNITDVVTNTDGLLNPVGLTIHNDQIYWTDVENPRIQRANLDGSNISDLVTVADGLNVPNSITIYNDQIYWTDDGVGKIQRANLDGTNVTDLVTVADGLNVPNSITIYNDQIYWSDSEKIQRSNLDGTNITDLTTGLDNPHGMTIHNDQLYWAQGGNTNKIQRSNLDGSNISDLVTVADGLGEPNDLTIHNDQLYWTSGATGGGAPPKIQRANLDGSNVIDLVDLSDLPSYSGHHIAYDITVHNNQIYWVDAGSDKIHRADFSESVTLQVGANSTDDDQLSLHLGSVTITNLELSVSNLESLDNAQSTITRLDAAIAKVNDERSNVGSLQNRLEFTSSNLMNSIQNNSASMSTIRDADFAAEAAELAKNQILTQSGTAMLAQANSLSQNVLSLIR
jgi:flagellin